jgi:predicted Zn-ribbon and HTH transcriptional regulator
MKEPEVPKYFDRISLIIMIFLIIILTVYSFIFNQSEYDAFDYAAAIFVSAAFLNCHVLGIRHIIYIFKTKLNKSLKKDSKRPIRPLLFDKYSIYSMIFLYSMILFMYLSDSVETNIISAIFWIFFVSYMMNFMFVYSFRLLIYKSALNKYEEEKEREEKARRKKEKEDKIRKEKEDKIRKEKEFEEEQIKKGLVKYKNNWITKHQHKLELKIDDFLETRKKSNKYKGLFMVCKSCGYVWKIRKDYDLPPMCPKCHSENIKLDRDKLYSKI